MTDMTFAEFDIKLISNNVEIFLKPYVILERDLIVTGWGLWEWKKETTGMDPEDLLIMTGSMVLSRPRRPEGEGPYCIRYLGNPP